MPDIGASIVERLESLIDEEKEALLKGDLPALPGILDEKIQIFDDLENHGARRSDLERLSEKAERNQKLLDEALAGIRSTAQSLTQLRQARRSIETYDFMGRKRTLTPDADMSVEKKA